MALHGKDHLEFRVIANTTADGTTSCGNGGCPTVYEVDDDTFVIQGYEANQMFESGFVPAGENVVRIPKGLIRQLLASQSI